MDKKKILIVEDERIIAEDLSQTLERLGYKVVGIAASGTKALKIAREEIPDLALMDIVLRGKLDGITVAQRLKDKFDVPSIYLTAYADKRILKRAKITAPYGYIIKPFDEKALHTNIEIALERSGITNLLERTNTVLRTVRDINQLIVHERDRQKLIQQACKILTSEKGYPRAWIVLLDGEGNLTHSAQSGWGKKFQLLLQMIKKGEIPECGKKAMTKKEVVVSKGSVSCRNCPFHEFYPEYYNLTIALVSHGWTQGLMSVALPERTLVEEPELNLFRELAGDVAFGLRDLELEDQRKQMNTALQESEARFRVLSESAAEAIAIHDKGVILDVNSTYCQLFGYERKEVIGRSVLDFAAPESRDLVLKNVKRGYQKPYEAVGLRKDGSTFIGELIGKPIPYIGRTVRATIIRDITERKQLEKILEQIVGGTSTAIGEDFFRSLISSMARSMKTDIVFITRLDRANPQLVRTLALWQKGRIRKNIAWEVADTPCEKVIKGQTVVVKKGVQGKFPRDAMLKEVKAESYLAVPILDMEGAVIGHLGVLDRRPMEYPQRFENIVRIFALRAGTELQRLQVEEELESIFASSPLPVMIVDEQRVIQRTNEAAEQYCQQIASELVGQRTGEVLLCIHRLDDPRGCGFGPDCKTCLTRNTILDTFQDHQTRQGVESEMSLLVKGQTAQRTIRLNTSYFESFAGPRVMVVFDDITEHKQIQTEVLRLKEFNEQIVTGMTEGIVVMDAGGIMEYINPAAEKMLGYSQTEMEGKHWSLIIPEDQHPIVNAVDERRMKGESSVYDLQLVRKDGQWIDIRISGSPRFQNSEFVGTMAVFTDITEQKRTDKALRESEEKFKSIFESFIDVYYRQDKDRLITMVSPSIRQFGYKPEDIIGTRGRDYYYDQAEREELVALLEKEGIIKDYRVKLRDARGNPVWTSANLRMLRDLKGNFAGIEGILRDITKRKQAEEDLRNSEERYRSILENIEEGYYEVDLEGNFTFFNDSLCKMLDYSRDELMGMNNRQYMDAESAKRVYKAFNEVYKTGKPSKTLDIRIRRNTGEIKFGEISITLLRDRNSKSVGFRGIVRDITERKQAEDQLRTSEDFNRTVLSSISEGFVVFDRDFHYVVWNHFMEIITGLKASEVIGKTPFDLFPFIKEHNLDKLLKRALKGEELISPDFQYSIPGTGREGWAISTYAPHRNSDGEIIGVVVLVRDITERKRAEEEIQRSAENLENLFRFTTDAIIIQNKKREILDCNRAVEELFGYTREELLQDQSIQLGDQNKVDLEKRDEVMQLAFDGQPQRFEWWGKRKDGTSFPEEILLNQTLYNGEKVLFITIRDITQQQQARDRIEQQAAQQQALLNIGRQLTASLDTNEIFNNMLESVRNLLNCNGVTIYMLEEDDQTLVPIMTYDPPFEKQVMKTKLDINHSLTGKVIETKQGMIFNKPISEEVGFQIPGTPEDEDDRIISVPIVVKDRAVGAITIYRKATAFTKDDLALMETFALYSGTAIQNAENHQMVKEKENRLRQAEEVAGMGFLYWNLRTDEIELSPQVIKMYGLEAEKRWVTPEFVEQVCHPEDLHYVKEQLNSTLTEEQPYDIDYRIVRPDGSILWVHAQAELEKDKDGQPIRLLGTVIDITERKETEQALAKSEKQYRTMIETAPDIIITVDKTGYITNANPAFTKLTGWELDEILHKHFTKLPWFRAKDVPQFVKIFNTMVRGQLPEPFEIHLKHADGSIHISEARVSSLYSDQVLAGFQFILHDITERNVAHQVLEQQAKFQKAIAEISREAVISVDLKEFMNFTVSKVANTLDVEYCKILEFQLRENSFLLLAGFGWKPGYVGKARVGAEKSSQAGYTLLSKKPVIVEDLRTEKRFSGPKLLTAHNVISGVSTIIGDHSEPWGVLGVHSVEKHVMTPATVGFIVSIANILNEAIIRHQLESKFRNLVENSPTGILSVNANGQVMQVNQKLLDILGSPSAEETMKINVLEFEPLKKAGASDGFRKVLKTGETIRLEHEYTSKWGKTVYLRYQVVPIWDEHDQIVGAQANIEDITEEKRTRQEINTLANAIKSIHESVSITDDKDRILFVNDAFLKTYGYVRKEVIGKTMELVWSPKNPPKVTQEILPATLKGGWQGELLNRRKDGSEFPVALSTSPVVNEKGEVVALIGVAEDITERKQAQEEITARAEELARFNKFLVDRERKMVELKREVNELLEKAGLAKKYSAPDKVK